MSNQLLSLLPRSLEPISKPFALPNKPAGSPLHRRVKALQRADRITTRVARESRTRCRGFETRSCSANGAPEVNSFGPPSQGERMRMCVTQTSGGSQPARSEGPTALTSALMQSPRPSSATGRAPPGSVGYAREEGRPGRGSYRDFRNLTPRAAPLERGGMRSASLVSHGVCLVMRTYP